MVRALALLGVLLLWLAVGPWVLVAAVGALFVPRVREWIWPERPWRSLGIAAGVVLVIAGLVWVVPDGRLPVPPGPGLLVTPRYVGRPAMPQAVTGFDVPQHPFLAPNGLSSMHDDAWATDTYAGPGPVGEDPEVDTAWFGLEECATLAFDSRGRIIGLCGDVEGATLRVLDPESMHPLATKDLPDRVDVEGTRPWENLCGAYFYLDQDDRAVLATSDRQVLAVATADADGEPDLTVDDSWDLDSEVPPGDCLVALMPDWDGQIWFATREGRVGALDPGSGAVDTLELGEDVANSLAVDEQGGVFVVTTGALYRLEADARGRAQVDWRRQYDAGSEQKPGQLSQGSGTTPTLLPASPSAPDGMVAITDNADPRMNVLFLDRATGEEICRAPVFEDDASATENSLVAVGSGVVVENNHGYGGPLSTALGRGTEPGFARVDVVDGECVVAWENDLVAPSSVAKASLETGLLYAYTARPNWWGVTAWYLSAIDLDTGRHVFSVRTGTGTLMNNHYAAVTLGPDGSAYIATLGGMVRVRDGD